jgi:hypothetical protein
VVGSIDGGSNGQEAGVLVVGHHEEGRLGGPLRLQ